MTVISCASSSPRRHAPIQHRITDSVLFDPHMANEIRVELSEPIRDLKKGSLIGCPHLATVLKNLNREVPTNHAPETLTTVLLAQLHFRGLEVARRFPRKLEAILSAKAPSVNVELNIEELNELETQLQAAFDQIQVRFWKKDFSTRTLQDALDTLYKIRATVDRLIAWVEKRLYGGQPQ